MNNLKPHIYTSSDPLPDGLCEENFFHSRQLFELSKDTPRHQPYMLTVEDDGRVVAQMLALVRRRASWLPPYLYRQCRVLGEGVYSNDADKDLLFEMMLSTLMETVGRKALFIEVSNVSQKMFGYRQFRQHKFFPVRWMSIHNSLHSRTPEERVSEKMLRRINNVYDRGVVTDEVQTDSDFRSFSTLLRHHNWLKPKRYIPADEFFRGMQQQGNARLFVTRHHQHIIGCSAVVYSERQAYLWYAAYRRKSFAMLHPDEMTIWHAIKDAHTRGYEHIFFMDVGLPYSHNTFREFILRFGGKPVSTFRWFHCSIRWINALLSWFYRD